METGGRFEIHVTKVHGALARALLSARDMTIAMAAHSRNTSNTTGMMSVNSTAFKPPYSVAITINATAEAQNLRISMRDTFMAGALCRQRLLPEGLANAPRGLRHWLPVRPCGFAKPGWFGVASWCQRPEQPDTMDFRALRNVFLTGLAVVLPLFITVWLVWWVGATFETLLGGLYQAIFPAQLYFPGLGIILGIGLTFVVGLLAKAWLFRSIFDFWDGILNRIPLIKTVYGAVQDFMTFVSGNKDKRFNRVVMVELDEPAIKLMGFVTREDFSQFPQLADDDEVAVFLPMSYQVGGYTLFLKRSQLEAVDMRAEEAMRFVLTAGLSVSSTASERRRSKD